MKRILVTLLIMLFVYPMMGAVLKGTIKDVSGNPLGGATIVIDEQRDGDPKYTVADGQGKFKISVSRGEHEVAIRMIGYETIKERLSISGTTHKDFIMYAQASLLATNSNSSGNNNVSNNPQNGNNAPLNSNNEGISKGVDLTNGLVAYYPFDGNANDMSGNGNHGTGDTGPNRRGASIVSGHKGQCYFFDQPKQRSMMVLSTYRFIYIRVPNSKTLNFTDAASFSFWFKSNLNNVGGTTDKGDENVIGRGRMKFFSKGDLSGGVILDNKCIEASNGNSRGTAKIATPYIDDWHHITIVMTKNYFKIYLDSKEISGGVGGSMNFQEANSKDLYIGCAANDWCPFRGCLDEFLIYNRELSAAEVAALYSGQGPDEEFMAYRRAKTASFKDAIGYLKNDCNNDSHRSEVENKIANSEIKNFADIVYCNDNYPKLADRLEDKMFGLINSVSDCETYMKYYSASKQGTAIDDKMFGLINSVSDCEAYMKHFSSSKRMAVVDDKMYQYVNESVDINDCEAYLRMFPKGKHKSSVVAQKNEIASYNVAKNGGKTECTAYLKKYPKGRFTSEIQAKIDHMSQPSTVAENASSSGGSVTRKPIVNENNIMDHVKSMKREDRDGDVYYYVYFKEGEAWYGTIRLASYGDWSWTKDGYYTIGRSKKANPNTQVGALLNLYDALARIYNY